MNLMRTSFMEGPGRVTHTFFTSVVYGGRGRLFYKLGQPEPLKLKGRQKSFHIFLSAKHGFVIISSHSKTRRNGADGGADTAHR